MQKRLEEKGGSSVLFHLGSEFVEMFVGMGAAKVRDLFKQANEKVPIIFLIRLIPLVRNVTVQAFPAETTSVSRLLISF